MFLLKIIMKTRMTIMQSSCIEKHTSSSTKHIFTFHTLMTEKNVNCVDDELGLIPDDDDPTVKNAKVSNAAEAKTTVQKRATLASIEEITTTKPAKASKKSTANNSSSSTAETAAGGTKTFAKRGSRKSKNTDEKDEKEN